MIKVKARFSRPPARPKVESFSFDPELTNYDGLMEIIKGAFHIENMNINVFYLNMDDTAGEQYFMPLSSDCELMAVLLRAPQPLKLKVEEKKLESPTHDQPCSLEKRDSIILPSEISRNLSALHSNALNTNVFKSLVSSFQKVIGAIELKTEDQVLQSTIKPPLSSKEFSKFLDSRQRLNDAEAFKRSVYEGGIEPSFRKCAWLHVLNIFPTDTTGEEQEALLISKTHQYEKMKEAWRNAYKNNKLTETQISLFALISVDVVRTDKNLKFYADEANAQKMFNILVTYSLYHPKVAYHQGMSDMASPLLFVMEDEARAYICFCALMRRLHMNFSQHDQVTLITKMQHLHDLVVYTDPDFAHFLRSHRLANMYFTQRWLLLELKREFEFDDALMVFEIQWATLPINAPHHFLALNGLNCPQNEPRSFNSRSTGGYLVLAEENFTFNPDDQQKETASEGSARNGTKYAVRDFSLINSLVGEEYAVAQTQRRVSIYASQNSSWGHDLKSPRPIDLHMAEQTSSSNEECSPSEGESAGHKKDKSSAHMNKTVSFESQTSTNGSMSETPLLLKQTHKKTNVAEENVFETNNNTNNHGGRAARPSKRRSSELHDSDPVHMKDWVVELPSPDQMGAGHPFLLFLCLSLLLEYRDTLMNSVQDPTDLIHFFQCNNKQHNTIKILNRARSLFDKYMRDQENKAMKIYLSTKTHL